MSEICPAQLLSVAEFERLSENEFLELVIPLMWEIWARPEQRFPSHGWRTCGVVAGRGWGKTTAIARAINQRVESGKAHALAFMAPNDQRVEEVQVSEIVAASPPWFMPERYAGGLIWPNGVRALAFTPEAPGRPRSGNFDLTWLCEIVDWSPATRLEAFRNISTATRVGATPQIMYDTTSKGQNEIILHLKSEHERDPRKHVLLRGSLFDNPMLPRDYLAAIARQYVKGSRAYDEEVLGKIFEESAGALWQQEWLNRTRVEAAPDRMRLKIVGVDPALSARLDADETGIVVGGIDDRDHVYLTDDLTGRYPVEQWGDLVIGQCIDHGCAGVVIERNHAGDPARYVIKSRATSRGWTVHLLDRDEPFPMRTHGRIYVREYVAASSKSTRASGPATETEAGRVHVVGTLPELERQFTTFEPGLGAKSPNNYDAAVYVITELRGLAREADTTASDLASAKSAHEALRTRLSSAGRGRRIGL